MNYDHMNSWLAMKGHVLFVIGQEVTHWATAEEIPMCLMSCMGMCVDVDCFKKLTEDLSGVKSWKTLRALKERSDAGVFI